MTVWTKDPNAVLDFKRDWTKFLAGDTIDTSTWEIEGFETDLNIDSDSHDDTSATVWLSGGTNRKKYLLTNTIVTAGARTEQWSAIVHVLESTEQTALPAEERGRFISAPCFLLDFVVYRNADWRDTLPRLLMNGLPIDLTGKNLVCYIRPAFDHGTLIKKLSFDDGGIIYPDAENGLAAVDLARDDVIDDLPKGKWTHHWVLEDPDESPTSYLQPWRGSIEVVPGSINE